MASPSPSLINSFAERFAFATSLDARRKLVESDLVAGSEDYFVYKALVELQLLQEHYEARVAAGASSLDTMVTPTSEEQAALSQLRSLLTVPASKTEWSNCKRWNEIEGKFHLLNYAYEPQETVEYLKEQLGLSFDHSPPQIASEDQNYVDQFTNSSTLDPTLFDTTTLLGNFLDLLSQRQTTNQLTNKAAFDELTDPLTLRHLWPDTTTMNQSQLSQLTYKTAFDEFNDSLILRHLWPDTATMDAGSLRSYIKSLLNDRPYPNLPDLITRLHKAIVGHLSDPFVLTANLFPAPSNEALSFLQQGMLSNLTLVQLVELRAQLPAVAENTNYVAAMLRKLLPNVDTCMMQKNVALNDAEQERFLKSSLEFVESLGRTFLDLKFNVFHAYLKFEMERDVWDEDAFLR